MRPYWRRAARKRFPARSSASESLLRARSRGATRHVITPPTGRCLERPVLAAHHHAAPRSAVTMPGTAASTAFQAPGSDKTGDRINHQVQVWRTTVATTTRSAGLHGAATGSGTRSVLHEEQHEQHRDTGVSYRRRSASWPGWDTPVHVVRVVLRVTTEPRSRADDEPPTRTRTPDVSPWGGSGRA